MLVGLGRSPVSVVFQKFFAFSFRRPRLQPRRKVSKVNQAFAPEASGLLSWYFRDTAGIALIHLSGKGADGSERLLRRHGAFGEIDFKDADRLREAFCGNARKRVKREGILKFRGDRLGDEDLAGFRSGA